MSHVATVTIDSTKVSADLTDFVIYIDLSDLPTTGFWDTVANGGGDIRVYKDDDTTELAREVVSCDTSTDTGELHVKFTGTLSSSADTDIHIYADGTSSEPATTATYGRNNVWTGYDRVYHMQQSGTQTDSTGNSDATAIGAPAYNQTGQIEDAVDLDTTSNADGFSLNWPHGSNTTNTITWSGWLYQTGSVVGGEAHIIHGDNYDSWIDRVSSGASRFGLRNHGGTRVILTTSTSWTLNTWQMFHATYDGSTMRVYMDGTVDSTTASLTGNLQNQAVFQIGKRGANTSTCYGGDVDEMRFASNTKSSDWVGTEHDNQNSPSTFYSAAAAGGGGGSTFTPIVSMM